MHPLTCLPGVAMVTIKLSQASFLSSFMFLRSDSQNTHAHTGLYLNKLCPLVVLTAVKGECVHLYMPFYALTPPGLHWAQYRIRSVRFIWFDSLPMTIFGISVMAFTWPFSVHTADIISYSHREDILYVKTHNR